MQGGIASCWVVAIGLRPRPLPGGRDSNEQFLLPTFLDSDMRRAKLVVYEKGDGGIIRLN